MPGITASRNYYPGDLIYSEESFVQVLPRNLKDVRCESCGKMSFLLRACKQCLAVKYCGKICQKTDWSTHRLECVKLKNLPEGHLVDTVRFLGKLILKIKGKDWKVIKKRVLGTDFNFDDIHSHYKDMTENPRHNLHYKELKELLLRYIGEENMPGDLDLIKIVGKVKFHTFKPRSLYFFIGASTFDLECIPNANVETTERSVKIWAIKKINKGIDKITIPSDQVINLEMDMVERDKFPCTCTDCSLPYGESILTRIIDEKRSYSVICETEAMLNLAAVMSKFGTEKVLRKEVDELLLRQEGVLGKTNRLHLKLLALKSLVISGPPLLTLEPLMDLEKRMRFVFGEYYSEMLPIYVALVRVHSFLGNLQAANRYIGKIKAIDKEATVS